MNQVIGLQNLNELIFKNKTKLILLYFGASWCKPCKELKKKIEEAKLANDFPNMEILHLDNDEDENDEIFKMYNVKNLPTIFFVKLNTQFEVETLHSIIGYDWMGIKFSYEKYK